MDMILDRYVHHRQQIMVYPIGEAAEGFTIRSQTAEHSHVIISGARSFVDRVHTVYTQINTHNIVADITREELIRVDDEEGMDITDTVELNFETTNITVTVFPCKYILLGSTFSGMPASGYIFTGPTIVPESVRVFGSPEILQTFDRINLENISLNNMRETFTRDLDIRRLLPEGVYLYNGEPSAAIVTFNIEPRVSRDFLFSMELIRIVNLPLNTELVFIREEPVSVTVRGAESFIQVFSPGQDDVALELNLSGLALGEHSIMPSLRLPRGYEQIGELPRIDLLLVENTTINDNID
jgi:YbbR domain-containing protein